MVVGAIPTLASAQVKVQIGGIRELPLEAKGANRPEAPAEPVERIEDPAQLARVFEGLITDIASNDFAARQRASEKLSANEQFDLAMLEGAMARPGLSLEARTRLFAIARQRFFRSPRAALGFQFGGMQLRDRVVVGLTYPPFDCVKVLEEGDMIVGADGFKLEGPGARSVLQSVIISHEPGEILKLVVRRGQQKLNLDVKLGRFSDLPQVGGAAALMEDRLSRAWRIRTQAKGVGGAEPIRVEGARAAPWGLSEEAANRKIQRAMERESNENSPKIAGGGTPRLVTNPDESRQFEPAVRQQFVVINGQPRMVNMPWVRNGFFADIDPDDGRQPLDPTYERGMLLDARMAYDKRLNGVDPKTLLPTDPLMAEVKARDLLNKQMDAIQAEIDENKAAAKDSGKHSAADANAPTVP